MDMNYLIYTAYYINKNSKSYHSVQLLNYLIGRLYKVLNCKDLLNSFTPLCIKPFKEVNTYLFYC